MCYIVFISHSLHWRYIKIALRKYVNKPFYNTLNYASTANIEEVMKFYNLGDKTFETDFNLQIVFVRTVK